MDTEFSLKFPHSYGEQAKAFFDAYRLINIQCSPETEMINLKEPKSRICRFCNRKYPAVSFSTIAHIIPEFLGNKYLISDFECDSCNNKLGRFDLQLSNYIGMYRTLFATDGKNGIPTLKSHRGEIEAKKDDFYGAKQAIRFGSTLNDPSQIKYDEKNGLFSIEYDKQPYKPFEVYKSLLKIALCLLSDTQVAQYILGYKFLSSKRMSKEMRGDIFSVIKYVLPMHYSNCFALLFESSKLEKLFPPLTFVLIYGCYMFQIFIPFEYEYLKHIKGKEIENIPIFPPFFDNSGSDHLKHLNQKVENLSSNESKIEKDVVHMQMDPNDKNRLVAIDPDTLTEVKSEYDPNSIVSFMLVRDENFSIKVDREKK